MNGDITYKFEEDKTPETKDIILTITNNPHDKRCLQARLIANQDIEGHHSLTIEVNDVENGNLVYHIYNFGNNRDPVSYKAIKCKKGSSALEKQEQVYPPYIAEPLIDVKKMISSLPLPDILSSHPAIIAIKRMQEKE